MLTPDNIPDIYPKTIGYAHLTRITQVSFNELVRVLILSTSRILIAAADRASLLATNHTALGDVTFAFRQICGQVIHQILGHFFLKIIITECCLEQLVQFMLSLLNAIAFIPCQTITQINFLPLIIYCSHQTRPLVIRFHI